ncbi:MAG: hypothetical protein K0S39_1348 [Paenibacillus sp.]|jgi:hypothetical protein|nr:hypothetical protein [Paenibacillus sp.]
MANPDMAVLSESAMRMAQCAVIAYYEAATIIKESLRKRQEFDKGADLIMEFNLEQFRQPSNEYRIHPFWFWNGEMTEEEIRHQYDEMVEKGVGGVFICARQGITIPYLSQVWFDRVRFAVEEAKKRNMPVWLYDEYPYPSGIAGGEVTLQHPEAKHYTLEHTTTRVSGGKTFLMELPWARLLYAKAVPVGPDGTKAWDRALDVTRWIGNYQTEPVFQKVGLTAYNDKRYFSYRPVQKIEWPAPEGEWELIVVQEKEIEDFKYYGTYVDPLNREAIKTFIRLTHDRFAEELGEYFGTTIKGMFTDETGFLGSIPWSPRIPAYFQEKYGYDIREHLPALLYRETEDSARIRYDFYQAVHELLLENYHKLMSDWCEKYGLEYVTEVPSMRITTQLYSHVPGGDTAHEKLGRPLEWILNKYADNIRGNAKMVSSIARQLERKRNLIECFHSVGWSMTLQDAKWMIDRMAAQGTNFYNFHAFFYTLDGLTKHDAPPSQFLQNPYWEHFRELGDYTGRISYVMSCGTAEAPIAVLFPVTTYWTHMGNPNRFNYGGREQDEKEQFLQLKQEWIEICNHLTFIQRDYDHLDPELLERAKVDNGTITIGDAVYSVLLLPPMTNLETKAWHKLREFMESGGKVIGMGKLPYETIEASGSIEAEVKAAFGLSEAGSGYSGARYLPNGGEGKSPDLNGLTGLLNELLPPSVTLKTEQPSKSFLLQTRKISDNSVIIFISNQEQDEHRASLRLDASQMWQETASLQGYHIECQELSLESGDVTPLRGDVTELGICRLPLSLAPYGSKLIQFTLSEQVDRETDVQVSAESPVLLEIAAAGPWKVQAERNNMVRLDTFALEIRNDKGESQYVTEGREAIVQVKTFIDQCSDLIDQLHFPVNMNQQFGTPMKLNLSYPLQSVYRVPFIIDELPAACRIVMDRGAISGEWSMRINGYTLKRDGFDSFFLYDHLNIATDIRSFLKAGVNTIEVEVAIGHDWDGLIDALYLEGTFGVSIDAESRNVLTRPVEQADALRGGPIEGFPYYAGTLHYSRKVPISSLPETDTFELSFDGWDPHFHNCAEVSINGEKLGVRAWSPYRWTGNTSCLREGENVVEVRATTTLVGLLEGKYFDYAGHSLHRIVDMKK